MKRYRTTIRGGNEPRQAWEGAVYRAEEYDVVVHVWKDDWEIITGALRWFQDQDDTRARCDPS